MLSKGFITVTLCAFAAFLISLLLNKTTPFIAAYYWISILLFVVLFIALNFFYNAKSDIKSYSQMLLGAIWIKLIILLVAIFLYSLWDKSGLLSFFVHFAAHYILFTVFEIRYLLLIIKNKPKHKL